MSILVLTARPEIATNRRLVEAARERGVEIDLVDELLDDSEDGTEVT